PEVALLLQEIERAPGHRASLAHPADRSRPRGLGKHPCDLAHLFELGLRIVVLRGDVLRPRMADDLDAIGGELPNDLRVALAGEAVGRTAALDLELVH